MPPVGAAIAVGVGLGGSALATTLITSAVELGASFGLSALADALAPKQKNVDRNKRVSGTSGSIDIGGVVDRRFIVGSWATAGSLVYWNAWGNNPGTPNQYLVYVIAVSDIPVTGITGIWVNGDKSNFNPSDATDGTFGIPITDYDNGGHHHCWARVHDGTQTTPDSYLTAKFGSGPHTYDATRIGVGVAYVVMTFRLNDTVWNGSAFPTVLFEIDGVKLYDLRQDSTAGGSGSHRWTVPSTWAFTRNPMVIAYNILRGIHYTPPSPPLGYDSWQYGGQTVDGAQLPFAEWAAAMNDCDTLITNADASVTAQYMAGGEVFYSTEPGEEIQEFLKSCAGMIADCGGIYKPHVGSANAAVVSITDADIMVTDPETFEPFQPMEKTINSVASRYISARHEWDEKAAKEYTDQTLVTTDGRKIQANLEFMHVSEGRVAQRLQKAALAEFRRERKHVLPMKWEMFAYEPLDFIQWSSARNGYVNKLFRIDQIDDRDDLVQSLGITEVDPADYNWHPNTDEFPTTPPTIKTIYPPPQSIADFAAIGALSVGGDGRTIAVIRLTWALDVTDVNGVLMEVRLASTSAVILRTQTDHWDAGGTDISENINGSTNYEVRGQYRSASNRTFEWSSWLPVTTPETTTTAAMLEAQILYELDYLLEQSYNTVIELENTGHDLLNRLADASTQEHLISHAEVGEAKADIIEVRTTLATATEAFAQTLEGIRAHFSTSDATIAEERTVRANADEAIATDILVVDARVDDTEAMIVVESSARATADAALAAHSVLVEAATEIGTATGLVKLSAESLPSGVSAMFQVYLRGTTAGAFTDAGFYLLVEGGVSKAFFDVDQFAIGDISNRTIPFFIDSGVVYMHTAFIQDLSVTTLKIAGQAINTSKIADESSTKIRTNYHATDSAVLTGTSIAGAHKSDIISKTIPKDLGNTSPNNDSTILLQVGMTIHSNNSNDSRVKIRVFRDDGSRVQILGPTDYIFQSGDPTTMVFAATYPDTGQAAGNKTYSIEIDPFNFSDPGGYSFSFTDVYVIAQEVKK